MTMKFSDWYTVETQSQGHKKGESRDIEHIEQWTGTYHDSSRSSYPAFGCGGVRNPGSLASETVYSKTISLKCHAIVQQLFVK